MKRLNLFFSSLSLGVAAMGFAAAEHPRFRTDMKTGVEFHTTDKSLQKLYDVAVTKAKGNIVQFTPSVKVLVEGAEYPNAWIETQPMGGEMFAEYDVQVALNNQVVFMLGQREDGRLPGMVIAGETVRKNAWDKNPPEGHLWYPDHQLAASYEMFQGYCFPEPAWRMYFWAGKDKSYLRKLYKVLEAHDAYLWRTRDSNGDGILETWCVWDTGEDASTRLIRRGAPSRWPFEKPPGAEGVPNALSEKRGYWFDPLENGKMPTPDEVRVPFASMDVMAYSYSGRATLAKISRELDNGKEAYWQARADEVRQRLIDHLWVKDRQACFDIDRKGKRLEELVHNNLRCMWYGVFTQKMADAFIKHHLLKPDGFWTPVPLVSMPVNEPLFVNGRRNDWSGPPQGLTYQRAIGALENYGHFAEVTMLARKLLPVLIRNNYTFTQQLDHISGEPKGRDGYGPMILAALEYINRIHGIHLDVEDSQVWWSGLAEDGLEFTRSQRWGDTTWLLECKGGQLRAKVNGKEVFTSTAGARIVTDFDGNLIEVVGIDTEPRQVTLRVPSKDGQWTFSIGPNQAYRLDQAKPVAYRTAPFDPPQSE